MNSYRVAVILPSRGLMFSQTADEILQNLQGLEYDIFFSHGVKIPDCFEKPLQRALNASKLYTHVWLVEDDMILPPNALKTMLDMDVPVATYDYPVSKKGQGVVFTSKEGRVIFTGTGCLLVKRAVFDKLSAPYFRTDIRWNAVNYGDYIKFTANKVDNEKLVGYGLHDVTFGIKLLVAEIPISVAGIAGQRKLIKLGKAGTNNGAHQIEQWTKVKPDYLFKQLKKNPKQERGILIPVQTVSGELMVHPDKAKKLIKSGVATKIRQQSVVIDINEVHL